MAASGDGPFQATFDARVVESFRGEWRRFGDALSDPGVARDFVTTLCPTHGPSVVRVTVAGGTEAERREVIGDWFCDDVGDHFGDNRFRTRVGAIVDRWEERLKSTEMVGFARNRGVTSDLLVLACLACARECLPMVRTMRSQVADTISVAEARLTGDRGAAWRMAEALQVADAQEREAEETTARFAPERYAAYAISHALRAAVEWSPDAEVVDGIFLDASCDEAVDQATGAFDTNRARSVRSSEVMCSAIRSRISTLVLLRSARDSPDVGRPNPERGANRRGA